MSGILPVDRGQDRSPVLKAFRLLAYLAASKEPIALAELSRALKLPKPTTHRLANSIERAGFAHKDPLTRRYRVGAAFEELALGALRNGVGHAQKRLRMNELAERLGARINLVVLKAGNLSSVEWVELTAPLRVDIGNSSPMPVHCTAGGKLLLAFGPPDLKKHVLRSAPFRANTKKTITSGRTFARELEKFDSAASPRMIRSYFQASIALRCRFTIAPGKWLLDYPSWRRRRSCRWKKFAIICKTSGIVRRSSPRNWVGLAASLRWQKRPREVRAAAPAEAAFRAQSAVPLA